MSKKILIAPLDWGLGHSTRCVPLIREHLILGNEVVLATNGRSAAFLRQYYPDLLLLDDIPDYRITYPVNGSFIWHLAKQIPHIRKTITAEHEWLREQHKVQQFDEVISDNRYGLWSDDISCSIITHQLFPAAPFPLDITARELVKNFVMKFDHCLVPDFIDAEQSLSGKLSHGNIPAHVEYIGPLSRFTKSKEAELQIERDYLLLISGPEPQRTIFQEKITEILIRMNCTALIVCGKPGEHEQQQHNKVQLISHLPDDEMKKAILTSRKIICRSGYSTVMDLHVLGKKAILVPTPGQTEQEYLAEHLSEYFGFHTLDQEELSEESLVMEE